jgi:hypothetical protein
MYRGGECARLRRKMGYCAAEFSLWQALEKLPFPTVGEWQKIYNYFINLKI